MFNTSFLETLTILYVEDEVEIAQSIQIVLNKIFKKVLYATNGIEAFELYRTEIMDNRNIDIIISDVKMPKMNGIDLLKNIRQIDQMIPFILTSAFTQSEYLLEAIEHNVSYYALKPINVKQLVSHIQHSCYVIHEHKLAEIKHQEAESYLNLINQVAIVSKTDVEGNITFVNDIFCDISGYTREELMGKSHNIVRHPDMPASAFKDLWTTIISGRKWIGSIKNRSKDGEAYHVNATIFPLYNNLNTHIKEYIAIRFLTTDDENQKREFKTQVRELVTKHNKEMRDMRQERGVLKRQLRQSDLTFLEGQLTKMRKKATSFSQQINYYEQFVKDFDEKIATQASTAHEKIDKLYKETMSLQKYNKKIEETLGLSTTKVLLLEEDIAKKYQELLEKSKLISDLRDVIKHREEQLGIKK